MQRAIIVRGRLSGRTRIDLDEPVDDVTGAVEVVVRPVPPTHPNPEQDIFEFLRSLPPGTRSKEDIDRQLADERDCSTKPLDLRPLQPLLHALEDRYHPEQIWLFGSRARGDARQDSDWDLLTLVPDDIEEPELSPLVAWRLRRDSGIRADVVVCRISEFQDDRDTREHSRVRRGARGRAHPWR